MFPIFQSQLIFSLKNLILNDNLINIPLFLVDYTDKLIEIAKRVSERKESSCVLGTKQTLFPGSTIHNL